MSSLRRGAFMAVIMAMMLTSISLAQGPLHKRVNYTINVSHALQMGDYLLPSGKYVLYQVDQNNTNLFALYQGDMTNSPVAMIMTTRIEYRGGEYPEDTRLMFEIDESGRESHPVLRGWNIPGMDGWEIISVVAKKDGVLTRVK
jgi:hypothetical protein